MFQCRVYIELKDIKLQIAAEICYVFFRKVHLNIKTPVYCIYDKDMRYNSCT